MKFICDELSELPEVISYDSLSDEEKEEYEGSVELKDGNWYVDGSSSDYVFVIPRCPFCKAVGWGKQACDHLVILQFTDSGEYLRLGEGLKLPEYQDGDEDVSSVEEFFLKHIPSLVIFEETPCEWSSLVWGFLENSSKEP